jgi:hypothetical protein
MRKKEDTQTLRVIPQRTFSKRIVSLVAEESKGPVKKGAIIKKINTKTLDRMQRPLSVIVTNRGGVFSPA